MLVVYIYMHPFAHIERIAIYIDCLDWSQGRLLTQACLIRTRTHKHCKRSNYVRWILLLSNQVRNKSLQGIATEISMFQPVTPFIHGASSIDMLFYHTAIGHRGYSILHWIFANNVCFKLPRHTPTDPCPVDPSRCYASRCFLPATLCIGLHGGTRYPAMSRWTTGGSWYLGSGTAAGCWKLVLGKKPSIKIPICWIFFKNNNAGDCPTLSFTWGHRCQKLCFWADPLAQTPAVIP